MSEFTVTKARFNAGIWEGIVLSQNMDVPTPDIAVSLLGEDLQDVSVLLDETAQDHWVLRFVVPSEVLSDGVQVFLIVDRQTGENLGSFTILSGEPMEDDIRADMELLRAELDMMKRAFRRHCLETT